MKTDEPRPPTPGEPSGADEWSAPDDAVIGRATRRSLTLVAILLVVGVGVVLWLRRPPPPAPVQVTELSAPVAPKRAVTRIPTVAFHDVTAEAGIQFRRYNGAEGEKLLPETMGGGAGFFDFDNDGDADVVFVNGAPWPWAKNPPQPTPTAALYRNDGQGHFTDVTAGSGLDQAFQGMGVACGDFDQDGRTDLFLTGVGGNRLFKNLGGGKFQDVTVEAGVGGAPEGWSTGAAFVDVDRDGDLDLFVANYVQWSRAIDFKVGYSLDGQNRAYGPPMNFQGVFPYLYRNDGKGHFADRSAESGVQVKSTSTGVPAAKSLGVSAADLNGDGWIDLVVANDTVQNYVFTNRHDGTFAEVGASLGVGFDSFGNARGAMGIDIARHRNDDALGIAIGNFANEMTALYVSQGKVGSFADEAIAEGIGPASRLPLKFGVFFFDYDLDGWQDLLTANGHLEEDISKIQKSQQYLQPAQLFWNAGATDGGFLEVQANPAAGDLFRPLVGRGSAFADIDGDGDLDVLLLQASGPPLLLRNDQQLGHRWVRFQLIGTKSNREAIGAWIKVTAGGHTQWRQITPTRSYLSSSELIATFGLGPESAGPVQEVEVHWPNGAIQRVADVRLKTVNTVREP